MDFTVKELAKVQPGPKRFAVMDSKTPGLALRVTPAGGKSWYYVYRMGGRGTLLRWMLPLPPIPPLWRPLTSLQLLHPSPPLRMQTC